MCTFLKISATGNDFILIDNREGLYDANRDTDFFRRICQRRLSVGADGVILLQKSQRADFRYVHVNSDGSLAEMCGNGSRAIAYFAHRLGMVGENMSFEINNNVYHASIKGLEVTTEFILPKDRAFGLQIVKEAELQEGGFIDTGVPHFVIFAKNVGALDVTGLGGKYCHHPIFSKGANADFVQVIDSHHLQVRTFERGVEAETLACGTGAVAASIISHSRMGTFSPTMVGFPGGELTVSFNPGYTQVSLTGMVTPVYEGRLL